MYIAVLSLFLDCMGVLLQGSTTSSPTTSSSTNDMVTVSGQQESSPHSSTTLIPTISEIPEPSVEETSSSQKTGTYVCDILYINMRSYEVTVH